MHHLAVFDSTLGAVAGYQQVNALADSLLPRSNVGTEYQIPGDWLVAAAFAGAAACVRARLITPSLALRQNPQIVPFKGALLPGDDPPVMDFTNAPIQLKKEEALRAEMESNSATNATVQVWLLDPSTMDLKVQYKDMRWVRGTVAVTTVAHVWTLGGALTLDEPMEGGEYTIYGMQTFFATNIASRLVIPGQTMRPGCIGQATAAIRSAELFRGGLGAWGSFSTFSLPQLEVLDSAAAAVTYTVWLLLARSGNGRRAGN